MARDEQLAETADLADIRARACSLLAQALIELERLDEGEAWLREASRLARAIDDAQGLQELASLQREVLRQRTHEHRARAERRRKARLADTPTERLTAGLTDPLARANVLLGQANALVDLQRGPEAVALAEEALALARAHEGLREQVFGHLALARACADRAEAHLEQARQLADEARDFNLIALIGAAAREAGVELGSWSS